jgi:hypothetical protein
LSIKYTKEILEPIVAESYSISEVLRKLDLRQAGGNFAYIKSIIQKYQIDFSHFTGKLWNKGKTCKRLHWSEVLVKDKLDRREKHKTLKKALIESGKEYICENCGQLPYWNGKELKLQIDHINGNFTDNTKDNLRFLCPNCHTQTENFSGSRKDKKFSNIVIQKIIYTCIDCKKIVGDGRIKRCTKCNNLFKRKHLI